MRLSSATIRFRLLALVCASLLPVALFALYLAKERHDDETEHARREAGVLARLSAAAHTQVLAQSKQLLAGLAVGNDSWDDALLGAECSANLRRVVEVRPLYKQIVLALPSGEVYCAAEPLKGSIVLDDREAFSEALATKHAAHTGIAESRLAGVKAITLAQPLKDRDGKVMAVLVAVLGLDWITERLDGSPFLPGRLQRWWTPMASYCGPTPAFRPSGGQSLTPKCSSRQSASPTTAWLRSAAWMVSIGYAPMSAERV